MKGLRLQKLLFRMVYQRKWGLLGISWNGSNAAGSRGMGRLGGFKGGSLQETGAESGNLNTTMRMVGTVLSWLSLRVSVSTPLSSLLDQGESRLNKLWQL